MFRHIRAVATAEFESRRASKETYTAPLDLKGSNAKEMSDFLFQHKRTFKKSDADSVLEGSIMVRELFSYLVPDHVSEIDFWQRYAFRCNKARIMKQLEMEDPAEIRERAKSLDTMNKSGHQKIRPSSSKAAVAAVVAADKKPTVATEVSFKSLQLKTTNPNILFSKSTRRTTEPAYKSIRLKATSDHQSTSALAEKQLKRDPSYQKVQLKSASDHSLSTLTRRKELQKQDPLYKNFKLKATSENKYDFCQQAPQDEPLYKNVQLKRSKNLEASSPLTKTPQQPSFRDFPLKEAKSKQPKILQSPTEQSFSTATLDDAVARSLDAAAVLQTSASNVSIAHSIETSMNEKLRMLTETRNVETQKGKTVSFNDKTKMYGEVKAQITIGRNTTKANYFPKSAKAEIKGDVAISEGIYTDDFDNQECSEIQADAIVNSSSVTATDASKTAAKLPQTMLHTDDIQLTTVVSDDKLNEERSNDASISDGLDPLDYPPSILEPGIAEPELKDDLPASASMMQVETSDDRVREGVDQGVAIASQVESNNDGKAKKEEETEVIDSFELSKQSMQQEMRRLADEETALAKRKDALMTAKEQVQNEERLIEERCLALKVELHKLNEEERQMTQMRSTLEETKIQIALEKKKLEEEHARAFFSELIAGPGEKPSNGLQRLQAELAIAEREFVVQTSSLMLSQTTASEDATSESVDAMVIHNKKENDRVAAAPSGEQPHTTSTEIQPIDISSNSTIHKKTREASCDSEKGRDETQPIFQEERTSRMYKEDSTLKAKTQASSEASSVATPNTSETDSSISRNKEDVAHQGMEPDSVSGPDIPELLETNDDVACVESCDSTERTELHPLPVESTALTCKSLCNSNVIVDGTVVYMNTSKDDYQLSAEQNNSFRGGPDDMITDKGAAVLSSQVTHLSRQESNIEDVNDVEVCLPQQETSNNSWMVGKISELENLSKAMTSFTAVPGDNGSLRSENPLEGKSSMSSCVHASEIPQIQVKEDCEPTTEASDGPMAILAKERGSPSPSSGKTKKKKQKSDSKDKSDGKPRRKMSRKSKPEENLESKKGKVTNEGEVTFVLSTKEKECGLSVSAPISDEIVAKTEDEGEALSVSKSNQISAKMEEKEILAVPVPANDETIVKMEENEKVLAVSNETAFKVEEKGEVLAVSHPLSDEFALKGKENEEVLSVSDESVDRLEENGGVVGFFNKTAAKNDKVLAVSLPIYNGTTVMIEEKKEVLVISDETVSNMEENEAEFAASPRISDDFHLKKEEHEEDRSLSASMSGETTLIVGENEEVLSVSNETIIRMEEKEELVIVSDETATKTEENGKVFAVSVPVNDETIAKIEEMEENLTLFDETASKMVGNEEVLAVSAPMSDETAGTNLDGLPNIRQTEQLFTQPSGISNVIEPLNASQKSVEVFLSTQSRPSLPIFDTLQKEKDLVFETAETTPLHEVPSEEVPSEGSEKINSDANEISIDLMELVTNGKGNLSSSCDLNLNKSQEHFIDWPSNRAAMLLEGGNKKRPEPVSSMCNGVFSRALGSLHKPGSNNKLETEEYDTSSDANEEHDTKEDDSIANVDGKLSAGQVETATGSKIPAKDENSSSAAVLATGGKLANFLGGRFWRSAEATAPITPAEIKRIDNLENKPHEIETQIVQNIDDSQHSRDISVRSQEAPFKEVVGDVSSCGEHLDILEQQVVDESNSSERVAEIDSAFSKETEKELSIPVGEAGGSDHCDELLAQLDQSPQLAIEEEERKGATMSVQEEPVTASNESPPPLRRKSSRIERDAKRAQILAKLKKLEALS